jgi:hypothetical protein
VLGLFADKKVPWPTEAIHKALCAEVGEMQRRWPDGRSFITDWIEAASKHPSKEKRQFEVKKTIENHLRYRFKAHFGDDADIHLSVHYAESGGPGRLSVEAWLADADSFNLPATEFFGLDFAPEPIELVREAIAADPTAPTPQHPRPRPTRAQQSAGGTKSGAATNNRTR